METEERNAWLATGSAGEFGGRNSEDRHSSEAHPPPPEASVRFEPNQGQVKGRTEWTARAAGAWLFLVSNEVVYPLPPEGTFDPRKTTNVHIRLHVARRAKATGEKPLGVYTNLQLDDTGFQGQKVLPPAPPPRLPRRN